MAITKINGFVAPYRSQTFQNQANKIEQTSGLLSMDSGISTDGVNVTIPPFDFIQDGLIVSESASRVVPDPLKPAPYFLTVSAATTAQVDDLSFQFPRSPGDISSNQVIIGMWDGEEWRKPHMVSIREIYNGINQSNVDYGLTGPVLGLLTTQVATNYSTSPGVITDRQGLRQRLEEDFVTPIVDNDVEFDRVDRIIYRRPDDDVKRIGMRQFCLGGAYDSTIREVHNTEYLADTYVNNRQKILVCSDNSVCLLSSRGYGNTFSIVYTRYSEDRTTQLLAVTVLVDNVDSLEFDACVDSSNNVHLFFTRSGDLYWSKYSTAGVQIVSPQAIHNHAYASIKNPAAVYNAELDAFYIVTQVLLSPGNNKIWFQSIANSNTGLSIIKPPTQISLVNGNLINPGIFMDGDLNVHIVAEDYSVNRVCIAKFDDNALPLSTPEVISDNTNRIGVGTLSGGAKLPKVFVTDNREVFVTFLQNKGASLYGVVVWNSGSAIMQDVVSSTENFSSYDVTFDNFLNGIHLLLKEDTAGLVYAKYEPASTSYNLLFTKELTVTGTPEIFVATARDKTGSMLHAWASELSTTYTSYASSIVIPYLGNQLVVGTLNTYSLAADQVLVLASAVTPKISDQLTISGSGAGNDGSKVIIDVSLLSVNAVDDYWLVTVASNYTGSEQNPPTPVVGDFASPDGNSCRFVKTNSELVSLAYRFDVLDTDILLARLSLPGPVILNYQDGSVGPTPAPTEKLLAHSTDLVLDWEFTNPGCLTTTGNFQILDLINNFNYTIVPGITAISEGEALYVELDLLNATPSFQVTPVATLPFSSSIQVIGVVKGGWFVPHFLLASLDVEELEPGEVVSVGHDLPDLIRERLGIISDTQYEIYYSIASGLNPERPPKIILDTDNYPKAISRLDAAVYDIQQDFNDEHVEVLSSILPANTNYVSTVTFDPDNTKHDIIVFVNGKKQTQDVLGGLNKDYYKYDVDKIRFSFNIPASAEISIFKIRKGGGSAGFLVGKDEGVQVTPYAKVINFIGDGVTATNGGVGQLNVTIPGGPAYQNLTKFYRNGTAGTIPANTAVAFDALGNLVLADANVVSLSDFVGVTKNSINVGDYGEVYKLGDCPDVITSLGAAPGDFVYLGEVPGELSLTPPPLLTDTIIIVGRAEPKNSTFPDGTATSLYLNPQLVSGA